MKRPDSDRLRAVEDRRDEDEKAKAYKIY